MIQYITYKDFSSSLQRMRQQGGEAQRKAEKAYTIYGRSIDGDTTLFHNITNHGESRIKHAIKYDLGEGYRLITIHDQKICMFCFAGNHDSCEKWLDGHKGLTIVKSTHGEYAAVYVTDNIDDPGKRTSGDTDNSDKLLSERLEEADLERFLPPVPPKLLQNFFKLNTATTENQLYDFASKIDDVAVSGYIYDVLVALRAGDRDRAIARIDRYLGLSTPVEDLSTDEIVEIDDGASIKKVKIGSLEYKEWFGKFINSAGYQDWMLFMHPAQQKIVDAEYEGSAKLSGVSGSGKTCIIVNRAIRLAKESIDKPILVLTLNRSLAALIQELLFYACPDEDVRKKITTKSFFELCQDYLNRIEPHNVKLHNDVTWKHNEHIDEIWREYYRCELNNTEAEVLLPTHKSLNSQGVNPEEYLRQELDWARSAYDEKERENYLVADRKGRAIPLLPAQRQRILKGLEGWENKMTAVGVIDYLGLSTKLSRHLDKLTPEYSAILVDEVQDFGTIELRIIRRLVDEGKNDIFLSGDMTQHVFPKHQSFRDSGINIPGARSLSILRNYRNSREILRAAYEIFISTMHGDVIMDGDIDILDPEYANFSTPKPDVLSANNLAEEISYALALMEESSKNNDNHKGCITITGYSLFEVKKFADAHKLAVLDGTRGLMKGTLFLSDLEQTKGYEFDTMCILNCAKTVLPPADMPVEEQYRDACRLYVAMTRAKRQLILSYSGEVSPWIDSDKVRQHFEFGEWGSFVDLKGKFKIGNPEKLSQFVVEGKVNLGALTGRRYLYTKYAIGLSLELQDKLDELVTGVNRTRDGKRVLWPNVKSAVDEVKSQPQAKQLFGPERWKELVEKVKI